MDEIVVNAAKKVYYTELPKYIEPSIEGDAITIGGEGVADEAPPTDPFDEPDPENCEDAAFMLWEAEQKKAGYDAMLDLIESTNTIGHLIDALELLLIAAGIAGIANQLERFRAISSVVNQVVTAAQSSGGGLVAAGLLTIYAANWGMRGRFDARIAHLKARQIAMGCPAT